MVPSAIKKLLSVLNAASIAAATQTSEIHDSTYSPSRALVLVFDVTSLTGTAPTLQCILELVDELSGKFVSFGSFTAVSAAGTYTYVIGLDTGAAADGITVTKSYPVPPKWRVRVAGGGTAITDADYTVAAHIISSD
jgi:hypothetical protein